MVEYVKSLCCFLNQISQRNLFVLFQDVLDSKNSAIKDLQYELARVCKVNDVLYSIGHGNVLSVYLMI